MLWVVTRRILACNAMLSDIKLRYKRLVWINFPFFFLCRTASFDNQRLKKKCVFYWKKEFQKFGVYVIKQYFCTRFRERNADEHWHDGKQSWGWTTAQKNFFEKKLRKSFGGSKIVLTFASAFQKKAIKEEFFERFRYKQASSTRAYFQ